MKSTFTALLLATVSTSLLATPIYHPTGTSVVYGNMSNGKTVMSPINNPAAGAATDMEGDTVKFGVFSSIGAGAEYGEIDNLFETIDAKVDSFYNLTNTLNSIDPNNAATEINTEIQDLNAILEDIEAKGYGKAFVSMHIPVMPVIVASDILGGALTFDMNLSVTSKAILLHENIAFNVNNPLDANDDIDYSLGDTSFTVNNDDTLLVRGAAIFEFSMGYSRKFLSNQSGKLYAGVRGKYYRVGLTRLQIRLNDLQDNSENVFDEFDRDDYRISHNIGLDLGTMWVSDKYQVGASLVNLNQPKFTFNEFDGTAYDPNGEVYAKIVEMNEYTMEAQLQLEGAILPLGRNWITAITYDANPAKDPFGDEYQWGTISTAFVPDNWLIPSVRAGYRANFAGSKLDYITGGITLFKVNIDAAYGLDEVQIDGETVPRSFMINIGLDLMF